jgi:RNA polymerase sigma factor (sigma-70 family)
MQQAIGIDPAEHLGLLAVIVRKYVPLGQPIHDSEAWSIGQLGLLKAARLFDSSRGAQFGTFAGVVIRRELHEYWRRTRLERQHAFFGTERVLEVPEKMLGIPDAVAEDESVRLLSEFVPQLPGLERLVVQKKLSGEQLREIAIELQLSRQRVHQVYHSALRRLRRKFERDES